MNQPTLFESNAEEVESEPVTLYALGDFQSRGKVLAERELALDRLRGAFKRAAEKFGVPELPDEQIAETLAKLGAKVVRVPSFVAKHPFRVTATVDLAVRSKEFYRQSLEND
jgi:hypothetical protein